MITRAAFVFSCSVDAMIEMEAMKAENTACQEKGQDIIYTQTSFNMLRDRMQNRIAEQYH